MELLLKEIIVNFVLLLYLIVIFVHLTLYAQNVKLDTLYITLNVLVAVQPYQIIVNIIINYFKQLLKIILKKKVFLSEVSSVPICRPCDYFAQLSDC